MFDKILIANRGEIACRIIKTARRMGIATVAVYSDADHRALHVEMADEAVPIGPAAAAESYLVVDAICDACRKTGARAVHPGYGFLSEHAGFAQSLAQAGITFIGPQARAIETMGDKIASKKAALAANVSTVPGYIGVIADEAHAIEIAAEIGYPVMIKASAGGGGKGMRIAHSEEEVAQGVRLAKSEARSSFGDDRLFVEKYITNPRHVEIQVLGDKHGNAIHLGERECSIQRRNQKVIEEAPSPLLDANTREEMGAQAVALARAVNYDSAGTVEFVAGQDKDFYFLEMNTRLQVEHPVTEMITGIDLVEQMIRIAAGETLAIKQDDVTFQGWAVEARIYAEDPYRGFLPSSGRISGFRPPQTQCEDATVRIDTGVVEGAEISVFYDPMIAKLITHGSDRASAIRAMGAALDGFAIDGIAHNIAFLRAIMDNPRWQEGRLSTGFIAQEFGDTFAGIQLADTDRVRLAGVALYIDTCRRAQINRLPDRFRPHSGDYTGAWVVEFDGTALNVQILSARGGEGPLIGALTFAHDGGDAWRVCTTHYDLHQWQGTVTPVGDTAPAAVSHGICVQLRPVLNGWHFSWRGAGTTVKVMRPRIARLAALMPVREPADTSRLLLCPMPGLVVSIAVQVGQAIKAGDELCVIEAMKMENVLRAERDVTVAQIHVAPGDSLAVDEPIMAFD